MNYNKTGKDNSYMTNNNTNISQRNSSNCLEIIDKNKINV